MINACRPHIPTLRRRRLWARPREEAVAACQDGEELDAQHGIGRA